MKCLVEKGAKSNIKNAEECDPLHFSYYAANNNKLLYRLTTQEVPKPKEAVLRPQEPSQPTEVEKLDERHKEYKRYSRVFVGLSFLFLAGAILAFYTSGIALSIAAGVGVICALGFIGCSVAALKADKKCDQVLAEQRELEIQARYSHVPSQGSIVDQPSISAGVTQHQHRQ
jgi:hypothetical protein